MQLLAKREAGGDKDRGKEKEKKEKEKKEKGLEASSPPVLGCVLRSMRAAYADVCWRMLAYADVCRRMPTYADVC